MNIADIIGKMEEGEGKQYVLLVTKRYIDKSVIRSWEVGDKAHIKIYLDKLPKNADHQSFMRMDFWLTVAEEIGQGSVE